MLPCFIIQNENIFYKHKTFPGYFLEKKRVEKQTYMWKIYETKIDKKFIMKTWKKVYDFKQERLESEKENEIKYKFFKSKTWNQEEKNDCK